MEVNSTRCLVSILESLNEETSKEKKEKEKEEEEMKTFQKDGNQKGKSNPG